MGDLILSVGKMTSLEIAKLTGKRHSHVLRDIDKVLKELGIDGTDFSAEYTDESGKANRMYSLDKRMSLILATGYSVVWRTKIIDRWEELERGKVQKPLTQLEIIVQSAQILQDHDDRIRLLESKTMTSNVEFFAVSGYAHNIGKRITGIEAQAYGKKAMALSKKLGYKTGSVPDAKWGHVGTYHVDILAEIIK